MEKIIFKTLFNEELFPIIYPELRKEYFENVTIQDLFKHFQDYFKEYGNNDLKGFLLYCKQRHLNSEEKQTLKEALKEELPQKEVLLKEIEKYIKKQALALAILNGAEILQKEKFNRFEEVLGNVEEAIKINFDQDLGLDITQDTEKLEEYLQDTNRKIPTGIESIDKVLGGGIEHKRLTLFAGPTHSGKTAVKVFLSTQFILSTRNGIYYTLEMPAEEIALRVYSSLLNIPTWNIKKMDKNELKQRLEKLSLGKLTIKDYPAGMLNSLMIESHIQKLEGKGIKIDFIAIDYIGLMASSRVSLQKAGGTYLYYKFIAEEIHALAKKLNIAVITSHQLNRSGYENTEAGMDTISDSAGLLHTADNLILLLQSKKMRENNQQFWKFEKNRQTGNLSSLLLETDFSRMRYKDISNMEDTQKTSLIQNIQQEDDFILDLGDDNE